MPKLALVLVVVAFLLLFGLRSVVQWWRTGSTGVKGFSGRLGSAEWFAGTSVSVGFLLVALAPVAALRTWPGGALLFDAPVVHAIGAGLLLAGLVGALAAQLDMGDSWRIGVDEGERTALVTSGLYRWMRNPIYSFMFVSAVGLLCVLPNAIAVCAVVLGVIGVELQVRAVEEPYLLRTHGSPYLDYCSRTGRFVPGLGRG